MAGACIPWNSPILPETAVMTDKFKSDALKIQLVEFSGWEFVRDGKITQPWIAGHIADPARRKKIERFKRLMLNGQWRDIREVCRNMEGMAGRSLIRVMPRKAPVLIFLPDGRPWEGKHRMSAVAELRGRIKPLEFACILGWPGSEAVDRSKYIRSRESSVYNFNAVRSLAQNGFKPTWLPPIDYGSRDKGYKFFSESVRRGKA